MTVQNWQGSDTIQYFCGKRELQKGKYISGLCVTNQNKQIETN